MRNSIYLRRCFWRLLPWSLITRCANSIQFQLPESVVLDAKLIGSSSEPPETVHCDALACSEVGLAAGQSVSEFNLTLNASESFRWAADGVRLRLIRISPEFISREEVRASGCPAAVPASIASWQGDVPFANGTASSDRVVLEIESLPLKMLMGGLYGICVSIDSSFAANATDLMPIALRVIGAFDYACPSGQHCLGERIQYCYLLQARYSPRLSCIVSFLRGSSGLFGTTAEKGTMRATWAAEWLVSYTMDDDSPTAPNASIPILANPASGRIWETKGIVASVVQPQCAATAPTQTYLCRDAFECHLGDYFVDTDKTNDNNQVNLPRAKDTLSTEDSTFRALTVFACFCPAYENCWKFQHFIQQVGIIHFFIAKVCLPDVNAPSQVSRCTESFPGITTIHKVQLQVNCPTDACKNTADPEGSRIKFIRRIPVANPLAMVNGNDLQSWDTQAGCRTVNESQLYTFPPNCRSPTLCLLQGGTREDVKVFGAHPHNGLSFLADRHQYARTSFHEVFELDVCFCIGDCMSNARVPNFFKIGTFSLVPIQRIASTPNGAAPLKIVNLPGSIGFQTYDAHLQHALGLNGQGLIKPLLDNAGVLDNGDCGHIPYSAYADPASVHYQLLAAGRHNNVGEILSGSNGSFQEKLLGKEDFLDRFRGVPSTHESLHLNFDGGNPTNRLLVRRPGVIALCYCGILGALDSNGKRDCQDSAFWRLVMHFTIHGPTLGQNFRPMQEWRMSTHTFSALFVHGFGLQSGDKLRVLRKGSSCNQPDEIETSVYIGCPSACKPADIGSGSADLLTRVSTSEATNCDGTGTCSLARITKVTVLDETKTQLLFSNTPFLRTGDTLSLDSGFSCSANCTSEDLIMLRGMALFAGSVSEYLVGRKVTLTAQANAVWLDIGWPQGRRPTFAVQDGGWTRHNVEETDAEIYSEVSLSDLPVCWSSVANSQFVAQAGHLTITVPMSMTNVGVHMSGVERGKSSPVVITFETSAVLGQVAPTGVTQLILRILKYSSFAPRFSDPDGEELVEVSDHYSLATAKQTSCGKLFKELWSGVPNGFPLPSGCYHHRFSGDSWELGIVFEPLNGLEPLTAYQIVLNSLVLGAQNEEVVQILAMDDVDIAKYNTLEIGSGLLLKSPQQTGSSPDAKLAACEIVGGSDGVFELSDPASLQVKLQGEIGRSIGPSALLRLYMWPLTQWQLSATCVAACVPYAGYSCGELGGCTSESVAPSYQTNILKVLLPETMDDIRGAIQHTFVFTGLPVPSGGLFPSRLGAQVSRALTDDRPSYIVSVGDHLYFRPIAVAALVDTAIDGDNDPFKGGQQNILYAKLLLGATLFSADMDYGASLAINLPPGYTCVIAGAAESDLAVFGQSTFQGRGTLDPIGWSSVGGTCWYHFRHLMAAFADTSIMVKIAVNNPVTPMRREDISNKWTVTLKSMGTFTTIQEVADIPFNAEPLGSKFSVNKAVLGVLTDYIMQPNDFQRGGFSFQEQRNSWVRIVFRTEQGIPAGGKVEVVAPPSFDVGENCQASDMDMSEIYAHGGATVPTLRLPVIQTCTGSSALWSSESIRNVAMLLLGRYLFSARMFAFQLRVWPPHQHAYTQQQSWRLYTREASGGRIDGTPLTIPMGTTAYDSVGADLSWGMYMREPLQLRVNFTSLKPFALTGQETYLHVLLNFGGGAMVSSTMRLTAPKGFIFSFPDDTFVYHANQSERSNVPGATATWPSGVPSRFGHVMLWSEAVYLPDEVYGFIAPISIPTHSPRDSPNAFLFEWGYAEDIITASWQIHENRSCNSSATPFYHIDATVPDCQEICLSSAECIGFEFDKNGTNTCRFHRFPCDIVHRVGRDVLFVLDAKRPFAAVVDAPLVRALINANIDYRTSQTSSSNLIRIDVQIVTEVPGPNGGIVIRPPTGFLFSEVCSPKSLQPTAEYNLLPPLTDLECIFVTSDGKPQIKLRPRLTSIAAGLYAFELNAVNPTFVQLADGDLDPSCGAVRCWYFSSHIDADDLTSAELDLRTAAPSFEVYEPMVSAGLVETYVDYLLSTSRNDRPGAQNNVMISFILNAAEISETQEMKLRAPRGFEFDEDCLAGVVFGGDVFGDEVQYPPQYSPFESDARVVACQGNDWQASLSITPGLLAGRLYVFRISVKNPIVLPSWNMWTVSFSNEASAPFPSFPLWQLHNPMISFIVRAARDHAALLQRAFQDCGERMSVRSALPVRLKFHPQNPFQRLDLTVPPGWQPMPLDLCIISSGSEQHSDYSCSVPSDTNTRIVQITKSGALWPGLIDFSLWVDVIPPEETTQSTEAWKLQTFQTDVFSGSGIIPAIYYDVGEVHGVALHPRFRVWSYTNPNEKYAGDDVIKLLFALTPAENLVKGDELVMIAPPGFSFGSGLCRSVNWAQEVTASSDASSGISTQLALCGATSVQQSSDVRLKQFDIVCHERYLNITMVGLDAPLALPMQTFENVDCRYCPLLDDTGVGNGTGNVIAVYSDEQLVARGLEGLNGCSSICSGIAQCSGVLWRASERDCHLLRSARCLFTNQVGYTCRVIGVLMLEIEVLSPSLPPPAHDNFWVIKHYRESHVLSSAAKESWPVVPQLFDVSLTMAAGALRATLSFPTTLELQFRSIIDAARMSLRILTPRRFNFTLTKLVSLSDSSGRAVDGAQVFVGTEPSALAIDFAISADARYRVALGFVELPRNAGQVVFDVTAFAADYRTVVSTQEAVSGFYVPGKLSVVDSEMVTEQQGLVLLGKEIQKGDVRTALPARWSETAFVRLIFVVSVPISPSQILRVISPLPILAQNSDVSEFQAPGGSSVDSGSAIRDATYDSSGIFTAVFFRPLNVDVDYVLSLPIQLPDVTDSVGTQDSSWTLEIFGPTSTGSEDAGKTLCTNDGLFLPEFGISAAYGLETSPTQAAPNSDTQLTITVMPGTSRPAVIEIVAPLRLEFHLNCLAYATRSIQSCETGIMEGRSVALLTLTRAAQIESAVIRDVVLIVKNPSRGEKDARNIWLAIGRAHKGGNVVGWGEANTIYTIVSMPVNLEYPPQPGNSTMLVTFGLTERAFLLLSQIATSATLIIRFASDVTDGGNDLSRNCAANSSNDSNISLANCDSDNTLARFRCDFPETPGAWYQEGNVWYRDRSWAPMRLPNGVSMTMEPCDFPGASVITFKLSNTLEGTYSLIVDMSLFRIPNTFDLPSMNWDITLLDAQRRVVDMYPAYEGPLWGRTFGISPLPIVWKSSAPGTDANVVLAFASVDQSGLESLQLRKICIRLPSNFARGLPKVNLSRTDLQMEPAGWTWVTEALFTEDRLCMEVDASNISFGEYSVTATVRLPDEENWPAASIWYVDMCNFDCSEGSDTTESNTNGTVSGNTTNSTSSDTVATFPLSGNTNNGLSSSNDMNISFAMFGFAPFEVHPLFEVVETSSSPYYHCLSCFICLVYFKSQFMKYRS